MEKAIKACRILQEICDTNQHVAFESLSLAVHAFYSRPFKRNGGVGKLNVDIVPPDRKGVHKWLEHFRDCAMAHTDAGHDDVAGRPLNDVVYLKDGDRETFSTLSPSAPVSAYEVAREHCEHMLELFHEELAAFHERFAELMPQEDGEFLFNLEDESTLFTKGYDKPGRGNLNYK